MVACATQYSVDNLSFKKYQLLPCMCCLRNHACARKWSMYLHAIVWLSNKWPSYCNVPVCPDCTCVNPPRFTRVRARAQHK